MWSNNYILTIGGYEERTLESGQTLKRSVYFKSLIDTQNYKHVTGEIKYNVFDQIKEFQTENENGMTSETIFKMKDYYVFGYYNVWDKKYYLRKFDF